MLRSLTICTLIHLLYSGKISRTINSALFKDFTAASNIDSSKSYYTIEHYGNLVARSSKFYSQNLSGEIANLENFLPQNCPLYSNLHNKSYKDKHGFVEYFKDELMVQSLHLLQ